MTEEFDDLINELEAGGGKWKAGERRGKDVVKGMPLAACRIKKNDNFIYPSVHMSLYNGWLR